LSRCSTSSSGKHIWKWKAKVDYAVKQIPQLSAILQYHVDRQEPPGPGHGRQGRLPDGRPHPALRPAPDRDRQRLQGADLPPEQARDHRRRQSAERKRLNAKIGKQQDRIAKLKTKAGYKIVSGTKKATVAAR
jgi:hypothetical protein